MAEAYPVKFEVEQSLHGSSLDLRMENWQSALNDIDAGGYECRGRRK
jgi:hypothetical protein